MKIAAKLFLLSALLPVSYLRAADDISPPSLTLRQALDRAVDVSERLKITDENREQSEARRRQARGAILPDVHWYWNHLWQDSSNNVNGALADRQRTDSRFSASQPLFQGFKEFAAMSAYKAQVRRDTAQLQRETILLYIDVSQAFYRVVELETNLRDLNTLITLTGDRVKDLRGRTRLGKTRSSEVVSAESQFSSFQAQRESYLGDIVASRDVLGFYLNQDVRSTVLIDTETVPSPQPESHYLDLAPKRSDIVALQENVVSNRYGIRVAKAGYYPFVGLLGNYYTQRTGFQSGIDWDVSLNLDVPIFQGGIVSAQVKEAQSLMRQAELELHRQQRFATSEISQAYATLISSIRQVQAYADAADKARASYDAQSRDYRLGLVNNLDVLASLNTMQQADANLNLASVQSKLNFIRLKCVTEDFQ